MKCRQNHTNFIIIIPHMKILQKIFNFGELYIVYETCFAWLPKSVSSRKRVACVYWAKHFKDELFLQTFLSIESWSKDYPTSSCLCFIFRLFRHTHTPSNDIIVLATEMKAHLEGELTPRMDFSIQGSNPINHLTGGKYICFHPRFYYNSAFRDQIYRHVSTTNTRRQDLRSFEALDQNI